MSMSVPALPSSRDFVTRLLASLASSAPPGTETESSPLKDAPESVKKQLLSLQVLFPNEFLPALDLLDRRLISRFLVGIEDAGPTGANIATPDVQMPDAPRSLDNNTTAAAAAAAAAAPPHSTTTDTVHYVRSAQHRASRFSSSYDSTTSYEVRLLAWNCTCPAFAFAAFPSLHPEPPVPTYAPLSASARPPHSHSGAGDERDGAEGEGGREAAAALDWQFGGVSAAESMPPVCKHLLACVLAEKCPGLFGGCVEERRVGVECAAGWAAGWGDA